MKWPNIYQTLPEKVQIQVNVPEIYAKPSHKIMFVFATRSNQVNLLRLLTILCKFRKDSAGFL